jgi:RNase P subunit RPR2
MKSKLSKLEIEEQIKYIFSKNSSPNEIKKIKKLAMTKNIKLGILKKRFCKKCYSLFNSNNSEVRIKKPLKLIKCKNCNHISRYKLK